MTEPEPQSSSQVVVSPIENHPVTENEDFEQPPSPQDHLPSSPTEEANPELTQSQSQELGIQLQETASPIPENETQTQNVQVPASTSAQSSTLMPPSAPRTTSFVSLRNLPLHEALALLRQKAPIQPAVSSPPTSSTSSAFDPLKELRTIIQANSIDHLLDNLDLSMKVKGLLIHVSPQHEDLFTFKVVFEETAMLLQNLNTSHSKLAELQSNLARDFDLLTSKSELVEQNKETIENYASQIARLEALKAAKEEEQKTLEAECTDLLFKLGSTEETIAEANEETSTIESKIADVKQKNPRFFKI